MMDFAEVDWAVDKQAQDLTNRLFGNYTSINSQKNSGKNKLFKESNVEPKDHSFKKKKRHSVEKSGKQNLTELDGDSVRCKQSPNISKRKAKNRNVTEKIVTPEQTLHSEDKHKKHKKKRKLKEEKKKQKDKSKSDVNNSIEVKMVSTVQTQDLENLTRKSKKRKLKVENEDNVISIKKLCKNADKGNFLDVESFEIKKQNHNGQTLVSPSKKQKMRKESLITETERANSSNDVAQPKKRRRKKKKNSNKRNKYAHLSPNYQKGDSRESSATSTSESGKKKNSFVDKGNNSVDNTKLGNIPSQKNSAKTKRLDQLGGDREMTESSSKSSLHTDIVKKVKKRKKKKFAKSQDEEGSCQDEENIEEPVHKKFKLQAEQNKFTKMHNVQSATTNKMKNLNVEALGRLLEEKEDMPVGRSDKSKKGKLKWKQERDLKNNREPDSTEEESMDTELASSKNKTKKGSVSLVERMQEQLKAARFRYLNEQLYTQSGKESLKLFQEDKEAFHVYHDGFRSQVSKWPTNPVDVIIQQIQTKPRNLVVADFGCGDAQIARTVKNKVHSFDLVAVNKHITVCDMAKVPLKDNSVDIAVFCLSLMGNNLTEFLMEANRVLKKGGLLKIAEVTSRFKNMHSFIKYVTNLGFKLQHQDTNNKMFCLFDFTKTGPCKTKTSKFHLEPCMYKKR